METYTLTAYAHQELAYLIEPSITEPGHADVIFFERHCSLQHPFIVTTPCTEARAADYARGLAHELYETLLKQVRSNRARAIEAAQALAQ